jgi:hypothetical protein
VLTHLYKVYNFKKIKITYEKFGAPWWLLRLRGNGPLQRELPSGGKPGPVGLAVPGSSPWVWFCSPAGRGIRG